MVAFRAAVPVLAALVAVAAAGKGYGYYETRTCTKSGDKCAGAEGYAYVKYAPCCDEKMACLEDASLGWGRFCVKPMKNYYGAPKCYKTGERCMGAPDKPYVEYHACCEAGDSCEEDAAMGWGSFCKGSKGYYTPEEPEVPEYPSKCYSTGDRCMGAPGKPYVDYMPCCKHSESCVADEAMGWGSFCKADSPPTPKGYYGHGEPPVVTTPPPSKYYGHGEPPVVPSPPPTKDYGYYKKTMKTVYPTTTDNCPTGENFELAADNTQTVPVPDDGEFVCNVNFEISSEENCGEPAERTPLAKVLEKLEEECDAANLAATGDPDAEPVVECFFEAVSPDESSLEEPSQIAVRMAVSARQTVSIFYKFEFQCPPQYGALVTLYFQSEHPGATITVNVLPLGVTPAVPSSPESNPFEF